MASATVRIIMACKANDPKQVSESLEACKVLLLKRAQRVAGRKGDLEGMSAVDVYIKKYGGRVSSFVENEVEEDMIHLVVKFTNETKVELVEMISVLGKRLGKVSRTPNELHVVIKESRKDRAAEFIAKVVAAKIAGVTVEQVASKTAVTSGVKSAKK